MVGVLRQSSDRWPWLWCQSRVSWVLLFRWWLTSKWLLINCYLIILQACMAGIVFAKFTKPTGRAETLMFSKNALITLRNGSLYLLVRLADIRWEWVHFYRVTGVIGSRLVFQVITSLKLKKIPKFVNTFLGHYVTWCFGSFKVNWEDHKQRKMLLVIRSLSVG